MYSADPLFAVVKENRSDFFTFIAATLPRRCMFSAEPMNRVGEASAALLLALIDAAFYRSFMFSAQPQVVALQGVSWLIALREAARRVLLAEPLFVFLEVDVAELATTLVEAFPKSDDLVKEFGGGFSEVFCAAWYPAGTAIAIDLNF